MESPKPETSNTSEADEFEREDLLTNDFDIIDEVKDDSTEIEDGLENEEDVPENDEKKDDIPEKDVKEDDVPEKDEKEEKINTETVENEVKEQTKEAEKPLTKIPETENAKEEKDLIIKNDVILTNIDDGTKKESEKKTNEIDFTSDQVIDLTIEESSHTIAENKTENKDKKQNNDVMKTTDKTEGVKNTKESNKSKLETKTNKDKNIISGNKKSSISKPTVPILDKRAAKKRVSCKIRFLRKIILTNWMSNLEKYRVFEKLMDTWKSSKSDFGIKYKIKLKYLTRERTTAEIRESEDKGSRESSVETVTNEANIVKDNKDKDSKITDNKNKNDRDRDDKTKDKKQQNGQSNKRKDEKTSDPKSKMSKGDKVRYQFENKLEPSIKRPTVPSRGPVKTLEEIRKERSKYSANSSTKKSVVRERRSNSKSNIFDRYKKRINPPKRNESIISNVPKFNRNFNTTSINKNIPSNLSATFTNTQNIVPTIQQQLSQALMNYVQNVPQMPIINQQMVQQPMYQQTVSSKPVPLMQQLIVKPAGQTFNREEPKISSINPWDSSPKELESKPDWGADDLFSRRSQIDRFETNNLSRNAFGNRSPERNIYSGRDTQLQSNLFSKDTSRDRSAERMINLKRRNSRSPPRFNKFARENSPGRKFSRNLQRTDSRSPDRIDMYSRNDLFSTKENRKDRSPSRSSLFTRDSYTGRDTFMPRRDPTGPRKNTRSPDRTNMFTKTDNKLRSHSFTDKELWTNKDAQKDISEEYFQYQQPEDNMQKTSQPNMDYQSNQLNPFYGQQMYMYQNPQNLQPSNLQYSSTPTTTNNFTYTSNMQMPYFNYSAMATAQASSMPNYYAMNTSSNSNTNFSNLKPTKMSNQSKNTFKNKNNLKDDFTSAFEQERNRRLMNK